VKQHSAFSLMWRVAIKEMSLFFASPIAYLFLAVFAAVSLFVFFWGEAFFARNIADVRPLFEWMPLLLIFLASTLTMRLWSEERRNGTIEHVFTQPLPIWYFVVGKFIGCMLLLMIALLVTLPLPITVSLIGDLDWGPVWAGYLATLLLGAAYISIGLYASSRSDNQIVSLLVAMAICTLFYLLGSDLLTSFFPQFIADAMRWLSTSARFESIARGVLDVRDLYYYLSLVALFLALNTYGLEKERWSNGFKDNHRVWRTITALLVANVFVANFWLNQVTALRVDVTEGKIYSISQATKNYLAQLKEPLLIRGYFSQKTHPLLAPLVPQLKDLIREYEIAGDGKVRVEIIDPAQSPELEKEANEQYGIRPVPFQVADRYQASIVSSYFDVLVKYGDEHQVLGFRDLIEVKAKGDVDLDVQLRNPEHDLTAAIKKVLYAYQAAGNLFETVNSELTLNAYISADDKLPKKLAEFVPTVKEVLEDYAQRSEGRFKVTYIDPQAEDGKVAQELAEKYGLQPMATSLFSQNLFYFHLLLTDGEQTVQLPLEGLDKESFERGLKAGIKRFAKGFTKTLAIVAPQVNPQMAQYGFGGAQFNELRNLLSAEYNLKNEDLSDGSVSADADMLLVLAPGNLDEKSLFAIDQFLMQGGSVVLATSPYSANLAGRSLSLTRKNSGLEAWLQHHGIKLVDKVVMDPQNSAFPVPVTRNVGGFQIQEMRLLNYPYFVDAREQQLNQEVAITSSLPQVTMAWASPVEVKLPEQSRLKSTWLVKSSEGAWLSDSLSVMPQVDARGEAVYVPEGEPKAHTLAVMLEGEFSSYFADKKSPLLADKADDETADTAEKAEAKRDENEENDAWSSVIKHSPSSARLFVFASNDFVRDQVIHMAGAATGSQYLNSMQLLANAVDWSLQDRGLMSIRARGHFNRTLPPMAEDEQALWEYANYALALVALVLIALAHRQWKQRRFARYRQAIAN